MPAFTEISVTQLFRRIGLPDSPVLIDVCIPEDIATDPHLIPGAIRIPHTQILAAAPQLVGQHVVVYCHKGLKLSQGAAALLRSANVSAESLEGGRVAWRGAGLPMVPIASIPPLHANGETLWVTRHRPKIDRIACPWLIRRFVDRHARFLYVTPGEVLSVAERFNATPFDIDDVPFSHQGAECSFDTMVKVFGLSHPPLEVLATIIRGADTNRHDLAPEAAGLLAIALGQSRMYRDDLAQLEAGLTVYDALYRWARDAQGEGHDWPATTAGGGK